jgi:hypothetical protein
MHLPVEKHKIIVKNCQLKYNYQLCFKIDAIFKPYKQNLLNFRHNFLFGVSSKISYFSIILQIKHWTYFLSVFADWETYRKINILNLVITSSGYIIAISFERVLRNIQKNLLLIRLVNPLSWMDLNMLN